MLDYNILGEKATITLIKDGEEYKFKDLLSETFNKNAATLSDVIVVNEYYVARPDLISLAVYGDDKYADILCKYNGISNPFEINENMLIYCPDVDYLSNALKGQQSVPSAVVNQNASALNKQNSNGTFNTLIGEAIHSNKKSMNSTIGETPSNLQKLISDDRTPAEQTVSDRNYIIDKTLGIVIY